MLKFINYKKIIFQVILIFFIFGLGILTHKFQISPYIYVKKKIDKIFFKNKTENKKKYSVYFKKIRDKYKNWDDKNTNLKLVKSSKYYPGINIFTNRNYFNHLNDDKMSTFFIIQLSRHYKKDLILKINGPAYIYRSLCGTNDNSEYENWEKLSYELMIIGASCIHTELVRLKVIDSSILLKAGGPVSSDPIFIGPINVKKFSFTIFE